MKTNHIKHKQVSHQDDTHARNQHQELASYPIDVIRSTYVNNNEDFLLVEPSQSDDLISVRSLSLSRIYSQQTRLRRLVREGATIMTPEQLQRLQACVEQIANILHEQTPTR